MAQKPSIPKGTRDFSPTEMVRRNYIFDTIKSVFKLYGFQPIETPSMENLSTLLGKYGAEGDKLLFKILNSGDFISKINQPRQNIPTGLIELMPEMIKDLEKIIENTKKYNSDDQLGEDETFKTWLQYTDLLYLIEKRINFISSTITEKGLRYDLTVPFARYVVQHRNEITFPFKRYQIQPVWRADRPQKGRYREFFQCDVDVIGSNSLLNEVELVLIMNDVFQRLKINSTIKINNRKVLFGIAEYIGETEKFQAITVAIDKLDKIGIEKVKEELKTSGISDTGVEKLEQILTFAGTTKEKIGFLKELLKTSSTGTNGMEEVEDVFSMLEAYQLNSDVQFDLTLARGLNYYTGAIFEVVANDVKIGSICGGGRYDDLTGIFGLPDVSGVGISFGADRLYDVMMELNLFPTETEETTQVLFVNFGRKEQQYCLPLVAELRRHEINTEMYPEAAKMKKQMTYANNKNIPWVFLIGENEMNQTKLTPKDMNAGVHVEFETLEAFITHLKAENK